LESGNMSHDASGWARLAERAAARAATYLLTQPPPPPSVWAEKGHRDFVTHVDRTSEQMIAEDLLRAEPASRVIGEESASGNESFEGLTWIVDPLDGTTNFLHRYPEWSVSIAAALDGRVMAGCVWDVPGARRCTAWRGGGAWCGAERLHVSIVTDPALALVGTGFPFKNPERIPEYLGQFSRILQHSSGIRRAGSAALDLCNVARGRFDVFWELVLAPWDFAAGSLLVEEAGGVVSDVRGEPLRLQRGGAVAGNARLVEWILEMINRPGAGGP
jgi:myo-inositol-1(or 4)-monophosphatase